MSENKFGKLKYNKKKMALISLGLAAIATSGIIACQGNTGAAGDAGAVGPAGPTGPVGPAFVAGSFTFTDCLNPVEVTGCTDDHVIACTPFLTGNTVATFRGGVDTCVGGTASVGFFLNQTAIPFSVICVDQTAAIPLTTSLVSSIC